MTSGKVDRAALSIFYNFVLPEQKKLETYRFLKRHGTFDYNDLLFDLELGIEKTSKSLMVLVANGLVEPYNPRDATDVLKFNEDHPPLNYRTTKVFDDWLKKIPVYVVRSVQKYDGSGVRPPFGVLSRD